MPTILQSQAATVRGQGEAKPFLPFPTSAQDTWQSQPGQGARTNAVGPAGQTSQLDWFLSLRPCAPNPGTSAQLLQGSINPLVPQAVNGMLIGLMGFMSTSPNELLPNEPGLFFLSVSLLAFGPQTRVSSGRAAGASAEEAEGCQSHFLKGGLHPPPVRYTAPLSSGAL